MASSFVCEPNRAFQCPPTFALRPLCLKRMPYLAETPRKPVLADRLPGRFGHDRAPVGMKIVEMDLFVVLGSTKWILHLVIVTGTQSLQVAGVLLCEGQLPAEQYGRYAICRPDEA